MGARKAGCSEDEIRATLNWTMAIRAGMVQSLFARSDVERPRTPG